MINLEPLPSPSLSAQTRPWCASMMFFGDIEAESRSGDIEATYVFAAAKLSKKIGHFRCRNSDSRIAHRKPNDPTTEIGSTSPTPSPSPP